MNRPKLLDLFCRQGGTSHGYHLAGFDVTGVDSSPQPRYPYRFIEADALAYTISNGHEYDIIVGSPPCQKHTLAQRIRGNRHPDFISPMRQLVRALQVPYVIENVPGAPLHSPIELCGATFGLRTYRHRLFESNVPLTAPPHPRHTAETVKMGRSLQAGDWYHAVGNFSNVDYVRADLGVPWMNRDGIRECVPPAYTEFIGAQLMQHHARSNAA